MGGVVASSGACGDDGGEAEPGAVESSGAADDGGPDSADGTATECVPQQVRSCYSGPPGTAGLGQCTAGLQRCADDGQAWLSCEGEVLPEPAERCDTEHDDDCDGTAQCEPTVEWVVGFNAGFGEYLTAADDRGRLIVASGNGTGYIDGTEVPGMYLAAIGDHGAVAWVKTVPFTSEVAPRDVSVTHDGDIVLLGYYQGEPDLGRGPLPDTSSRRYFVARFDGDGQLQWIDIEPELWHSPNRAASGPEGAVYTVGQISRPDKTGFIDRHLLIRAHGPDGERAWTVDVGGFAQLVEPHITWSPDGGVFVVAGLQRHAEVESWFGEHEVPYAQGDYRFMVFRTSADGEPLGLTPLSDEPTSTEDFARIWTRPGGGIGVFAGLRFFDGPPGQAVVQHFDAQLGREQEWRLGEAADPVGFSVWPSHDPVVAIRFVGMLDLGGHTLDLTGSEDAVAIAQLREGEATWSELLRGELVITQGVAQSPDGSVFVSAITSGGGRLGQTPVEGPWLAKIRP